jgi:hypothetical protein
MSVDYKEFGAFWKVSKLYNTAVETFLLTTGKCKVRF